MVEEINDALQEQEEETQTQEEAPIEEAPIVPDLVIAMACNNNQHHECWGALLGLNMPDEVQRVSYFRATGALTDQARNTAVKYFLRSRAQWLFFVDDDVELEQDTLQTLWEHTKEGCQVISGVYYRGKPPHDPLMYYRLKNGWYAAITGWQSNIIVIFNLQCSFELNQCILEITFM